MIESPKVAAKYLGGLLVVLVVSVISPHAHGGEPGTADSDALPSQTMQAGSQESAEKAIGKTDAETITPPTNDSAAPVGSQEEKTPETAEAEAASPPIGAPECPMLKAREIYEAGTLDVNNPIYPIIYRLDFAPKAPGESVLALRVVECEGKRNFAVFTKGGYLRNDTAGNVVFVRESNLAVVNNYNESGDAWQFEVSAASRDTTDTWCLPKKEFCTKRVDRTAFGITDAAKAEVQLPSTHVYSLIHGEEMVLQAAFTHHCGKRPELPKTCLNIGQGQRFCRTFTYDEAIMVFDDLRVLAEQDCAKSRSPAASQPQPKF